MAGRRRWAGIKRPALWLAALLGFGAVLNARAEFELSGYLKAQNVTRFVVTDGETGQLSPWLFMGDLFQGYTVMRFDAAEETLIMERGTTTVRLPLKARALKAELPLSIRPDGSISMDGQSTTVEALESLFKDHSSSGRSVVFVVRTQPGQESFDTINRIASMIRDSGAKKWAIRLIDVTADRKAK